MQLNWFDRLETKTMRKPKRCLGMKNLKTLKKEVLKPRENSYLIRKL